MDFANKTQEAVYNQVVSWMREMFGEQLMTRQDAPMMAITRGTAMVQVGVHEWREDSAIVRVHSYVVFGAENTPQLHKYLLNENDHMLFGAFAVDQDGDIAFQHTIVGNTIQKEELRASVLAVAFTADEYDEKITSRFGGQRAVDRFK